MKLITKILLPKLIVIVLLFLSANTSVAQNFAKASKMFDKAYDEYVNKNFNKALVYIDKALSADDNFTKAQLLKAEIYLELNNDSLSILAYERLFEMDSLAFPQSVLMLSKLYNKTHKFEESLKILDWFLTLDSHNKSSRQLAEELKQLTSFRKNMVKNPVSYNPKNIGGLVNTSADEYINQYSIHDDRLIFTRRFMTDNAYSENIFVTDKIDSLWSVPRILFGDFTINADMGAANFSAQNNEVYFSVSLRDNFNSSCDIYGSQYVDGKWTKPENILSVNTNNWESQPCVSYDDKELYFARRDKKLGTSDLFVSYRNDDNEWGTPVRLNSKINTEGNEMAPFIHHDMKTLYFSSDTHNGMGGYDLFMSRRDENGEWTDPVNIGYPLNTEADEINLVVAPDAKKAYISAKRDDSFGAYDIYEFILDDRFRPSEVIIDEIDDDSYYAESLKTNKDVILKNIYFEFDSAELMPESEEGIKMLYDFLTSNPQINIELTGHTDDVGDEDYNIMLSGRRAESVKNALVTMGVSAFRIKTKGYGSTQPLFPNTTEELRALNRRVSMTVD